MAERVTDLEQARAEGKALRDEVADDQLLLFVECEADADAHLPDAACLGGGRTRGAPT